MKMPISLTLNNFRCWENNSFSFNDSGIILISGISGKGKSTILNSIMYAITGNLKNVATFGKEKSKLEVILSIDDIIITRGKNPTRFIVKKGLKIYEEHEAQSILDQQFGTDFKHISYIDQDNSYSFVYLTPDAKMTFLRNLLLADEKIDEIKDSLKTKLDLSKKELISHDSTISVASSLMKSLSYRENVCKILKRSITSENYEDTLQLQTSNLEISKKNRSKLISKYSKLESEQQKYQDHLLQSQKKSEIESELATFDIILLKQTLEELQQQKNIHDKQQLSIENQRQYKNDLIEQSKLTESLTFDTENFKFISTLEKIINIQKSINSLEDKIGEEKEEELQNTKESLIDEIKQIHILLEQQNTYECPSCQTNLKFEAGKLLKTTITPSCTNLTKDDILKKQKILDKIQKEITLLEKSTEEYNSLFDEFELLVGKTPFEIDSDFNLLLTNLKKDERSYNILFSKLNEIEKRIESYDSSDIQDLSIDIYSIIEKMSSIKESIKRYSILEQKLSSFNFESLDDHSQLLSETKTQIQTFEEKIEQYDTSIKQLTIWKQTHDSNTKYTELSETIQKSKDAKDYLMEEVKSYEKLLYYVKEAETRSIFDFIDSLNKHASLYIQDFFPDEDIRVQLVTNKELKSGKDKVGLFFEVQYHTIKGDIEFLSGGQRDRVNLAFTLAFSELVQNRMLLLDECISSLDSETSDTVIDTLKEKYRGKLILCVAHQVNTGAFDQVVSV